MSQTDPILAAFRQEFASLRQLADRGIAQLDDRQIFATLGTAGNSVAVLMKHVGGNLRSRWTDVLTTDGEKPDRDRDAEFEIRAGDDRAAVEGVWNAGWAVVDAAIAELTTADLGRAVSIRGEVTPLPRALTRSLAHTAGHVHQILLLARHWRGDAWETVSIPRGQSQAFLEHMRRRHSP